MPARPTRSRFMGQTYTISFDPVVMVEGDECYGCCTHDDQSIHVLDGMPHDRERDTVLHESLHQMLSTANVGLDEVLEEKIVTFLGSALVGHMRDNPTLWRYLLQKPPKDTPCK